MAGLTRIRVGGDPRDESRRRSRDVTQKGAQGCPLSTREQPVSRGPRLGRPSFVGP